MLIRHDHADDRCHQDKKSNRSDRSLRQTGTLEHFLGPILQFQIPI